MSVIGKSVISRRRFMQLSAAAATAAVAGSTPRVLYALVADRQAEGKKKIENLFSACDMCFNKCGLIARVEDGVVKKLDPNPKSLKSRGMLCARGNAGVRQLYDPDRLKYPLLRKGARGEGKWQRLTWEQALDHAAEQMERIGREYTRCGFLFMAGTDMQSTFVHRFAEVYGSFNVISHESNCLLSRNRAFLDTFGVVPTPDVLNSRYIIMPGANRFEALVTPDSMDLMTAMQAGCKLVVLDPRFTKTAALADEWHAIRPGTDMAFFLAVAHVLIGEDRYDKKFVDEKTSGFEALTTHVKPYTPDWAAAETDIPARDIRRISRQLAAAAPAAMVYPGRRSSDYEDSTQIRRSYAIVNALLGNWDRKGGLIVPAKIKPGHLESEPPWYDDNPEDRVDAGRARMMFDEEGSFKHTRDAVIEGKPYPVKGWMTYKTNPMQTGANRNKTIEMIHKLDFMVTIDIAMSDTAWLADLVLPAPSYLERKDPLSAFLASSTCSGVTTRNPIVPPLFESRPAFWIVKELAKRLNLGEHFDFTMDDFRNIQLEGLPEVAKAIEEDGVYNITGPSFGIHKDKPFKTRSKKIELYNTRYKDRGIDPMPVYTPPKIAPPGHFRIVVGRNAYITQSASTNNSLLWELEKENTLWIHPRPAKRLGIVHNDMVEVKSTAGKGRLKARVTTDTRPDTVYMDTGFGVISKGLTHIFGKGACIAEVLEDRADEISGNMAMHETFVAVKKV
ncbi:MAG: molybdopterin-dependent oxidoreductase [Desulfobacteraceae bacterium]|jgi:thiosulfate reductase/polysulfide reductase chain A